MRGVFLWVLALAACSDDTTSDGSATDGPLAIAGSYVDAFGSTHEISDELWVQQYAGGYPPLTFHVMSYDNTLECVIAQNDAANTYDGNLFSRFDWVWSDSHLYYCQTTFSAATEQAAEDTPRSDDTDPTVSGCGGFSWTDLTP